ncbi:efflux RND transporter periplasmic adaptor subunit [Vibrio hippocampi]|nr:HlyD family efflux transporter periplasmic adaptor subunit [Vibrio hippocampi]
MKLTNNKFLFFPALAIGIIAVVLAVKLRPDAPTKPAGDRARVVDVMALSTQKTAPLVMGFGRVEPKVEWQAIAEVTGAVTFKHPGLEKGSVVAEGAEILRIDPLDYQLKLSQAIADLKSSETQLTRLDLEESNLKETLKIENSRLALAENEYQRRVNLNQRGLASQSDVDTQQQNMLSQKKLVQEIKNQLSLLPDERQVSQALVNVNQAKVEEAQRSLQKTKIIMPQTMRVATVDVEINQVVNVQQSMVSAHRTDVMEVEAQLSIHDLQLLFDSLTLDSDELDNQLDKLHASIELSSGNLVATWPAKVSRISETVDPNQATAGVILEIEQNSSKTIPPLVNGMFVKASIEGQANPSWVIPERALHGDKIYIMNAQQRLAIRSVEVLFRRDKHVVIAGELNSGDKVVLNDLLPAIEGMLLREKSQEVEQ